jgi:outer membrane protein insertion porin family
MPSCIVLLALAVAGQQLPDSPPVPPRDSPPLVRIVEIAFPSQGNVSFIDPETYLHYIHTRPSRPSEGLWVPYDEQTALADFRRLWASGFVDNLQVDVHNVPFENGVVGKHVTFILEERQRARIVDYEGANTLGISKIEEALKEANADIRVDSFVDATVMHKCEGVLRDMLRERGFHSATVTHRTRELPGGTRLVHLTFQIKEGPKVRIQRVNFAGNTSVSDRALKRQMKDNKQRPWGLPFFLSHGSAYQEAKFEDDADRVIQYYRDHGYITARVDTPELKPIRDSRDGRTRWIELRIPVSEGKRYKVGDFRFEGNTLVKTEALRPLFKIRSGKYYRENAVRKGLEKARELYGAAGYFEFTGYPDLKPRDHPPAAGTSASGTSASGDSPGDGAPVLDVTMRMQEGRQHFVNHISFSGNQITRDNVIRRELALVEGGIFNTEALKYSIKRLNQLGYFKPLEDQKSVEVVKTPGTVDRLDVTLKLEEQNRNQLTFGLGMSQYEGIFGSFSYTAGNFLGRGESLTVSLQRGTRSKLYEIALTEPYLFDQPISGSAELYSRKNDFYGSTNVVAYSEVREGTTVSIGRPVRRFGHGYLNYTYEVIDIAISDELLASTTGSSVSSSTTSSGVGIPSFSSFLDSGRHIDSRITPTFIHNTVDHPIFPHSGMRLTGSVQVAGELLRGSYNYLKPETEAILYVPTSRRTGFGFRAQGGWLRMYGSTTELPYYLRYFLGGEYQIRGVDIRTVGPVDASNRALGGNKFVLFNAEYYIDIVGPVRAVLFHDAGQAFAEGQRLDLRQLRTSSGAEVRVVVPMLNVPFRLILAWNKYRDTFQPERAFKFAVGTTF